MPNYHSSIAVAARRAASIRAVGITSMQRPLFISASSASSSQLESSPGSSSAGSTSRMIGNASSANNNATYNDAWQSQSSSSSFAILAATIAATSLTLATNNSTTAYCESSSNNSQPSDGLADETEDGANVIIQDGMDAGSDDEIVSTTSIKNDNISQAEENTDSLDIIPIIDNNNNSNNKEEVDEDDPSHDEPTTCSICLINRQGPCRKYWLKFEGCMKEHGSMENERDNNKNGEADNGDVDGKDVQGDGAEGDAEKGVDSTGESEDGGEEKKVVTAAEMEGDWDDFMIKSVNPGEDDDDDDDDEDEDEESGENETDTDNSEEDTISNKQQNDEDMSLAQRCDKYMIPWISCIQEHRNLYSLISNAFYQKDYIDPLEDSIHDARRLCYNKDVSSEGGEDGVIKFHGVSIDLGSWMEHVEAESDDDDEEDDIAVPASTTSSSLARSEFPMEEPYLINAFAKFQLTHPTNGKPIEVAYIKDQKERLLGFDSFTKSKTESDTSSSAADDDDKDMAHTSEEEKSVAAPVSMEGECTFHIVPGETTSITAYAVYRGDVVMKENDEEGVDDGTKNSGGMREDYLFTTPEIPLPKK